MGIIEVSNPQASGTYQPFAVDIEPDECKTTAEGRTISGSSKSPSRVYVCWIVTYNEVDEENGNSEGVGYCYAVFRCM